MKTLIIVNPRAGGGRALKRLPMIRRWMKQRHIDATFVVPDGREQTVAVARDAARQGYQAVLAMGGDGTIAATVEGAVKTSIAVGAVPSGRGNDIPRNLDYPSSLQNCVSGLVEPKITLVDVPTLNGKPFLGVGGVGFDSEVIINIVSGTCKFQGTLCYFYHVVKTLLTFKPAELQILIDGTDYSGRYMMASVANGPGYGGGMRIAPGASMEDGLLDICLIDEVSIPTFLRHFPSVYAGKHTNLPFVRLLRGRDVRIDSEEPQTISADGDIFGVTPAHFKIGDYRIRAIVPVT